MAGIRIKIEEESEFVIPKIEEVEEFPTLLTPAVLPNTPVVVTNEKKNLEEVNGGSGAISWKEFSINIDLSGVEVIVEIGTKFLETLDKIIKIYVKILKILRLFNTDFKSLKILLKVIIKNLIKNIKQFIESLSSSGIYATAIIPGIDERIPGFTKPINGGFREFKATVSQACLDKNNISTPPFKNEKDKVGGFIIALGAATNDPHLLKDLIQNMKVLANFFGFASPVPPPPKNVKAVSVFNRTTKKPEIKLTWDHPDTLISGFAIYRSENVVGSMKNIDDGTGKSKIIRVYDDKSFNNGEPVKINVIFGKQTYSYIDTNVENNKTYYYKIYSTAGFDFVDKWEFLRSVESPMGSRPVKSTARSVIPLSELDKYTLMDIDGNIVSNRFFTGNWVSVSVRDILGPGIDEILKLLDNFGEKIIGYVNTSGDVMDKYIKFLDKKIQIYLKILYKIKDIIQRIMEYRLQGSVLTLFVSTEEGGMENFVKRVLEADIDVQKMVSLLGKKRDLPEFLQDAQGNLIPIPPTSDPPPSPLDSMGGAFMGVVLVWGFPDLSDEGFSNYFVTEEEKDKYKKQLDKLEKSLEIYKKILGLG